MSVFHVIEAALKSEKVTPGLAMILVGERQDSQSYARGPKSSGSAPEVLRRVSFHLMCLSQSWRLKRLRKGVEWQPETFLSQRQNSGAHLKRVADTSAAGEEQEEGGH